MFQLPVQFLELPDGVRDGEQPPRPSGHRARLLPAIAAPSADWGGGRACSVPAGDFAGWVREINAAVADAERAAGEAEQAAAGSGSWFSRSSACINAEGRVSQAVVRVQGLTFGTRRPSFVPAAGGSQAWNELRERLDEAGRRARAACSSIAPPR